METEVVENSSRRSVRQFVFSVTFVLFLYWFCALHVRINMMINGYDAWMTGVVKGDKAKVSYYTDVMAYSILLGTIPSPVVGILTDFMRAKFGSDPGGMTFSSVPALTLTSVILTFLTLPLLLYTEPAIYVAVVLFAIGKPYLYCTASTFIALACPMQNFGLVYGILFLVGGLAAFMMYPYFIWVERSGTFTHVNGLILATSLLTLSLPVWLVYTRWCHRRGVGERSDKPSVGNT